VGSLDHSGKYNYKPIFNESNWKYTGLDIQAGNNVDLIVTDIYNWFEIEDNTYDVIISGQFFEHLEFFWLTMNQIERVLKPDLNLDEQTIKFAETFEADAKKYEKVRTKLLNSDFNLSIAEINYVALAFYFCSEKLHAQIADMEKAASLAEDLREKLMSKEN
jgi:SAM-dependent methyltransferase